MKDFSKNSFKQIFNFLCYIYFIRQVSKMIALQTVRSLIPVNIPFFRNASQDDLITRVSKVAYRILEYLFSLIEKGIDYLIQGIEPESFYIRYKRSIQITVIALSIFGMYMGSKYIKNKVLQYINSFVPDSFIKVHEKISMMLKGLFNVESEINPKPFEEILSELKNLFKNESSTSNKIERSNGDSNTDSQFDFCLDNIYLFFYKIQDVALFGKNLSVSGYDKLRIYTNTGGQLLFTMAEEVNFFRNKIASKFYDLSYSALEKAKLEYVLDPAVQMLKTLVVSYFLYKASMHYMPIFPGNLPGEVYNKRYISYLASLLSDQLLRKGFDSNVLIETLSNKEFKLVAEHLSKESYNRLVNVLNHAGLKFLIEK